MKDLFQRPDGRRWFWPYRMMQKRLPVSEETDSLIICL